MHEFFEIKRINHQKAYGLDGACPDVVEKYFCRLRRAEIGIINVAGAYCLWNAQEPSWRKNDRRDANGDQVNRIAALAMKSGESVERI